MENKRRVTGKAKKIVPRPPPVPYTRGADYPSQEPSNPSNSTTNEQNQARTKVLLSFWWICVQLHFFCCQNYCWYIIGLDNKKPTEPVLFKSISSVKFKNKVASIYRVKRWLNNTKELICLQSKYPITTAFFLDEGMRYLPDQCKGHSFWLWTHGMVP